VTGGEKQFLILSFSQSWSPAGTPASLTEGLKDRQLCSALHATAGFLEAKEAEAFEKAVKAEADRDDGNPR